MSAGKIVIRQTESSGWTSVPHDLTNNPDISWKAKGLWTWLASRPEGWVVRLSHLVTQATDGASGVRTGLDELEAAGYISRRQVRDDDGKFVAVEYTVHRVPNQPDAEKPHTEKPHTENRTLNKKESNKKRNSIPEDHRLNFLSLWKIYPKRDPHPNHFAPALKAYSELVSDGAAMEDLYDAVVAYGKYIAKHGTEPQYVMTTVRFLNTGAWQHFLKSGEPEFQKSSDGLRFA